MAEPTGIYIEWEVEVTEKYRAFIPLADLHPDLQAAVRAGADIGAMLDTVPQEYSEEEVDRLRDKLSDLVVDHEEGPNDESVDDRTIMKIEVRS